MLISEAVSELRKSSESIDSSQPVQIPEVMSPGEGYPQGDIVLKMIEALPSSAVQVPWEHGDRQIAPGTSRGSRHCIPSRFQGYVRFFSINDGNPLSDLVITAEVPFDLVHPEHADHVGYPPGIYRVKHQQNAQRERVLD